jgi:hypothetical protein
MACFQFHGDVSTARACEVKRKTKEIERALLFPAPKRPFIEGDGPGL